MTTVRRQPKKGEAAKRPRNEIFQRRRSPGTSHLEGYFIKEFLEKMKIDYVYQYYAKEIGRFYDFYLPEYNVLIEIDGDYWHGNPREYPKGKFNAIQKKNRKVDKIKDDFAKKKHIQLFRLWEFDLKNRAPMVKDFINKKIMLNE